MLMQRVEGFLPECFLHQLIEPVERLVLDQSGQQGRAVGDLRREGQVLGFEVVVARERAGVQMGFRVLVHCG